MLDFYRIAIKEGNEKKGEPPTLYPDWIVGRSKDLMVRGKSFYAIWDEERGLWSTDEYDVQRLVDQELHRYADDLRATSGTDIQVRSAKSFNSGTWSSFRKFMMNISDNSHPLDEKLVFANTEVKKNDYASKRLSYSLEEGSTSAWDELVGVLYSEDERAKIEWAIGAIVSGDSKKIQKFLVFYGPPGSGKSTILNIMQKLFEGYVTTFDAKALGGSANQFATEVFRTNPLLAIQHDGDLSKIEDNAKLNSIISHEEMPMNEKYKPAYSARINALLAMGTNQPVKISDAKSGIIRRLIDVHPTGAMIATDHYHVLMQQIDFELGAIAYKCLQRYLEMGKNYYSTYKPIEMMLQTDVFYNFVEWNADLFKAQNGVSLKQAYELYKTFCADTGIEKMLPQYKVREELRNYFEQFNDRTMIEGREVRSYYSGFKSLAKPDPFIPHESYKIELNGEVSIFDTVCQEYPAQYAKADGTPETYWANVKTTLAQIETDKLHFVKLPEQHIVIDFDLTDEDGEKSLEANLKAAESWPPTYAELSRSGDGLHLHYHYTGDVHELANIYDVGIEVKTLLGDQSLRRKLTRCNALEIATISGGLPKKEVKPMLDDKSIKSEKGLRDLIERNLRKEIHPGTKPSVDFIAKILEEAYESGLSYDVTDMRSRILAFAGNSTHQPLQAMKVVKNMKWTGKDAMPPPAPDDPVNDAPIVFYDVEVYPNLFVVCWKYEGAPNESIVKMINPTAAEIEPLFKFKLVGFNNRRYDNHILYGRYLGYPLEQLFNLSQRIINSTNQDRVLFGEAYNLSHTDIYDFTSKKQGLKKYEIELGLHHMELDLPWDQPVPEDRWQDVVDYCCNDVIATEATFIARKEDYTARLILAELSGLTPNHTTQQHTAKIIFGEDKQPQSKFVYTDLAVEFPGYTFDGRESTYRGEVTGEGGYVYAEPGMYENVTLLDIASMHPTSIEVLNLFGPYTANFSALKDARLAIKGKEYETARGLLGGRLGKFLVDAEDNSTSGEALSYALKIVINTVYGLTSAKFPNPFRDPRNMDNIVAKRGALFMINLKHEVQKKGFEVVHIKTDSIKIPNATPKIIEFITEYGKQYGYDFEHEATYDKFCLVNDAVYIARQGDKWTAVGAQFAHPYVYKSLFTHEEVTFSDLCETKHVAQGVMYLQFDLENEEPDISNMVHVGKTGSFVPVLEGGGALWRVKDDKKYAVTGTKGYLWIEQEVAAVKGDLKIDMSYFESLKEEAVAAIDYWGSFERFVA